MIVHDPHTDGYKKEAPYDIIIINGLVEDIPQILFDQLSEGGRLIAVLATKSGNNTSKLGHAYLYHKVANTIAKRMLFDACSHKLHEFNIKQEFQL